MRMGRAAALLIGYAVVAVACGPDGTAPESVRNAVDDAAETVEDAVERVEGRGDPPSDGPADQDGPPSAGEGPAGEGAAPPEGARAPGSAGGSAGGDGRSGGPRGTDARAPDRAVDATVPDDRGPVGSMCRTYLRSRVPRLVVEIDHQAGAALSQGAVDHLVGVLRDVVAKPGGVVVRGGSQVPGGARTWTADDLRRAARRHRDHFSSREQAVMYVLSVRGESRDDAIGVAFHGTEFAVFPDEMGGLGPLTGGREAVERAVLAHEAGHLLCLVNIGYTSELDHADPAHPHHSRDRGSVMHWAVDTSAVGRLFSGPPPDGFTADDRADLEALRRGRY